ncbi:MAG: hypothetical protein JWS12_821 [Candidatus Saccharibacteria bacterium]|nr:hypothetical protein [Candidatus Saccharibacteria bacterium]
MSLDLLPDIHTVTFHVDTWERYQDLLEEEASLPPIGSDDDRISEQTRRIGATIVRTYAGVHQLAIDEIGRAVDRRQRTDFNICMKDQMDEEVTRE